MKISRRALVICAALLALLVALPTGIAANWWNTLDRCDLSKHMLVREIGNDYVLFEGSDSPVHVWDRKSNYHLAESIDVWLVNLNATDATFLLYERSLTGGENYPVQQIEIICRATVSRVETQDSLNTTQALIHPIDFDSTWRVDQYIANTGINYFYPVQPLEMSSADIDISQDTGSQALFSYSIHTWVTQFEREEQAQSDFKEEFRRHFGKPFALRSTPGFHSRVTEVHEGCTFDGENCDYFGRYKNYMVYLGISALSPAQISDEIWQQIVDLTETRLISIADNDQLK